MPTGDRNRTRQKHDDVRRVRDALRARLLSVGLAGAQLPSESDLMREFGTGRNVVRAALDHLRSEALIVRKQGEGTFATATKSLHPLLTGGVAASVSGGARSASTRVLDHRLTIAGATGAERLGVDPATPCLSVDSVTALMGEPTILTTSYIADPEAIGRLTLLLDGAPFGGGWYSMLAKAGLDVRRRELVVEVELADALVAADLAIAVGSPMLFVARRLLDEGGDPVEYGFSHCRGDRLAFAYLADNAMEQKVVAR